MPRCQGTTRLGVRCKLQAGNFKYCSKHRRTDDEDVDEEDVSRAITMSLQPDVPPEIVSEISSPQDDFETCRNGRLDVITMDEFEDGDPVTRIRVVGQEKDHCLNPDILSTAAREKRKVFVEWVPNPKASGQDDEGHGFYPKPGAPRYVRVDLDTGGYYFIRQDSIQGDSDGLFQLVPESQGRVRVGSIRATDILSIGAWHGQKANAQQLYRLQRVGPPSRPSTIRRPTQKSKRVQVPPIRQARPVSTVSNVSDATSTSGVSRWWSYLGY